MAKRAFTVGAVSQTIDVFIKDSSSTIGAGLSGLVFNTSNLKAYYRKGATGAATAITLATQTVAGAWSSGGFVEVDAVNMKGVYRLDVPDTVFAVTPWATLYLFGAANMAPVVAELEVVSVNPFDVNAIADALLDRADGVETSWTIRKVLRVMFAAIGGKSTGLNTGVPVYRAGNDSKDRITATSDIYGNRSAVTLDAS